MINTRTYKSFEEWEPGQSFGADTLLFLYESDGLVQFRIRNMTEDATRNWLVNAEFDETAQEIVKAMMWSQLYGDAIVVLYDEGENNLLEDVKSPVALQAFHPLAGDCGYTVGKNKENGWPAFFKIRTGGFKSIVVNADRCVIFPYKKTTNSWRGYSAIGPVIDEIIFYRKWVNVFAERASKVAVPSFHANKKDGTWTRDEKENLEDVFGEDEVAATSGEVTFSTIGGALEPNEIEQVCERLLERIAACWGVTKADLKGAEAGQKLSTDANRGAYQMALVDIQRHYTPHVKKVLERMGLEWTGWNTPWEMPIESRINNLIALAATYEQVQDPEIKAIIKDTLMNT